MEWKWVKDIVGEDTWEQFTMDHWPGMSLAAAGWHAPPKTWFALCRPAENLDFPSHPPSPLQPNTANSFCIHFACLICIITHMTFSKLGKKPHPLNLPTLSSCLMGLFGTAGASVGDSGTSRCRRSHTHL